MRPMPRDRLMAHPPAHPWFSMVEVGIVRLTMPPSTTDADVRVAFEELSRWMHLDVDAPYAFVIRLDGIFALTATQRRIIADAEIGYAPVELRFNAGQAIVLTSAVQRGIFAAFTWLSQPVWPYRIFGDEASAAAWLGQHMERVTPDFPDGPHWTGRLRRSVSMLGDAACP